MKSTRGLTLMELLVAMALTGIVSFIVIGMITGQSANYTTTRTKIKLQSDTREAMRIIQDELKNAGFRTKDSIVNGVLTASSCGNSFSVSGKTSYFMPLSNGVRFHVYNPFQLAGSIMSCGDDLYTVQYTWDSASGILSRKSVHGASASIASVDSVPFLAKVTQFKLTYGVYSDTTYILSGSDFASSSMQTTGLTATRASDSAVTLSGWSASTGNVRFLKVFSAMDTNATYRISFTAYGNTAFMDSTTGYSSLKAGLFANGSVSSNLFTFCPGTSAGAGSARTIEYDMVPGSDVVGKSVTFGIVGSMKSSASGATLSIGNLTIQKLNSGHVTSWVAGTDTTAPWNLVGAVQVQMTAVDGKDTIIYIRQISLVNNDGTN
jgi:prepilin-type N-terminal cleavage/methylation domain-containing protein